MDLEFQLHLYTYCVYLWSLDDSQCLVLIFSQGVKWDYDVDEQILSELNNDRMLFHQKSSFGNRLILSPKNIIQASYTWQTQTSGLPLPGLSTFPKVLHLYLEAFWDLVTASWLMTPQWIWSRLTIKSVDFQTGFWTLSFSKKETKANQMTRISNGTMFWLSDLNRDFLCNERLAGANFTFCSLVSRRSILCQSWQVDSAPWMWAQGTFCFASCFYVSLGKGPIHSEKCWD